ncbi:hypothetical protein [Bacteroides sp. 224]|uniref:hypothetical protein n=1 Tax=Bacteroides sp. 224 TaxID=2302936 RepID=UPI0013D89D4A|nr:hypothetical protein [Bacteroides sp. 224]
MTGDEPFFQGNFKVIFQGEHSYIFNLHNGRIYYIEQCQIRFLGKIILDNYSSLQHLFYIIEDRDKEEVLVFGPIEWAENQNTPLPNVNRVRIEDVMDRFNLLNP